MGYVRLALFNKKNTDLKKYWNEGDIKITVNYEINNGEKESIFFEFELFSEGKIDWPST